MNLNVIGDRRDIFVTDFYFASYNIALLYYSILLFSFEIDRTQLKLEMWANAQRDGRPVEYSWRPLLNAAVWLMPTTRVPCSNAAKTRNPLKLPGVPQTNETILAASWPKFKILWPFVGTCRGDIAA